MGRCIMTRGGYIYVVRMSVCEYIVYAVYAVCVHVYDTIYVT